MNILKNIFGMATLVLITQACHKTTIVIPSACMTLSAATLHVKDTLTIYNCSKSDVAYVSILDSVQAIKSYQAYGSTAYRFSARGQIQYVFANTGPYHIYLEAINLQTGSPIEMDSTIVQIVP